MYTEAKVPEKSMVLPLNQAMEEICKPLALLTIETFNYVRIYNDGSRVDLTNHLAYLDQYYHKGENYFRQSIEGDPFKVDDKIVVWTSEQDQIGQVMHDTFRAHSGIIFIQHYQHYCELFHFISHERQLRSINFFINHEEMLRSFILYFKDKAEKLIQKADRHRIVIPKISLPDDESSIHYEHDLHEQVKLEQFLKKLDIKRWHFPFDKNEVYLTKQELTCLKWSITGKSAEEISLIMGTSRRTCEAHLDNIKKKMNCHKQLVVGYKVATHIPQQLMDMVD